MEAKRKITMPRIGFVKFGTRGSNKLFAIFTGLMAVGLGVFFAFTFAAIQDGRPMWIETMFHYGMILIGLGDGVIASLFAYTMGLNRLYGHGLLWFALFASDHFISVPLKYLLL